MASSKPLSKTLMVKCGFCNVEMLDENLKAHRPDQHSSSKYVAGDSHITSYFSKTDKKRKLSTTSCDSDNSNVSSASNKNLQPDKVDDVQSVDVLNKTCLTTEDANSKLDEILSCVKDIQISVKQNNQ